MSDRTRMAYILTPVEFGGSERVNLTFLKNIDRGKYDISPVLLVRPWEKENYFIQELKKEKYRIYEVPVAIRPRSAGPDYLRFIRCYRMIHSFLSNGSFDLVHTHGYFADTIAITAATILGIPRISTCHGFIANDAHLRFYNVLDRSILRAADKIIAVSARIKDDLIRSGIKKTRVITIQNAVNMTYTDHSYRQNRQEKRKLLNIAEEEFVVGYIGRLSEEKGVRYLIKACSLLDQTRFSLKLVLVGSGPQRRELETMAKKEKMEERTFFAGFQNDIQKWLPLLDIFVLPSLTEGTPMALLEAMAFGVPVVASAVGGIPQIIQSEQNGILVSPGNAGEIKKAIEDLRESEALRIRLSKAGQETAASQYDVKSWVDKVESEYLKLVCKK